ncbi:heat shock factor protein 2 isoform X2 [Hemicordylus capensis]|uniref:heat shock factor protein 2 isoform X2 n=1 Tax=Hemicordylus capensis TaxID=884348 RepID=UPI0023034264|nr:heat shock factor protein 2 isoform X2 [Hemicordylus capensis]
MRWLQSKGVGARGGGGDGGRVLPSSPPRATMKQQPAATTGTSAAVPAFLSKLWALVGDAPSNQLITWSQNGQSFLVLDEQRFSKEILPKYFKHNNMASFVRQLNMYGFRKVVHVDSGIVKLERDGPVEFQHPYFKQGREDLLEHIKRKVSSSRPEENKIRQEDLSKIISSAQKVQVKQETIESRLSALKRENESLWREVAELRAKHLQQQQVIRKIVQFIVTLVQNNQLVSLKRKRPLLLNTNGAPKSNLFQQIIKEPTENKHNVPLNMTDSLKQREQLSDDIIIYDITDDIADEEKPPVTPENSEDAASDSTCSHYPDIVIVEDDNEDDYTPIIQENISAEPVAVPPSDSVSPSTDSRSPLMSSAVQLNSQSALTAEDPVSMMDSILSENGVISQNINLLGKVELLDYLESIDCSLEDFQAMLSGRQFSIDPDLLVDMETKGIETTKTCGAQPATQDVPNSNPKSDKQLIQYTAFPLLAFLDGNPGSAVESTNSTSESASSVDKPLEVDELLESSLDPQPTQSKLVRLEPLTEAEASEATLFYLCELAPVPMDTDMPLLNN